MQRSSPSFLESIVKQRGKQKEGRGMTCEMAQRAIALAAMSAPEAPATRLSSPDLAWPVLPGPGASSAATHPASGLRRGSNDSEDFTGSNSGGAGFPGESIDSLDSMDSIEPAEPELAALLAGCGFPPDFSFLGDHPTRAFSEEDFLQAMREEEPEQAPSQQAPARRADADPSRENSELAAHLSTCRSCQAEMTATTAFFRALASESSAEPSATLLARSRMRLDASLDSCEQSGLWTRLTQQLAFTTGRLRAAPVLCSGLLVLGLAAGGYAGYRAANPVPAADQPAFLPPPPAPEAPSVDADVSSISHDPGTGLVEVRYDRLVPDVLTAPANDPSIRELLMAATENGTDPQVRNASVNLLSASCAPGTPCASTSVRNALLNALGSDKTPEVRREALAGLQPFIADDMGVRDAVLTARMSDPRATVRIEAVRLLQPVDIDSSVRQVLHTVAAADGDPRIRSASLEALKAVPQVQ